MDEQKKKKVLLAVLAVVGLGAGGYYGFLRDSESDYTRKKSTGSVERRQRKVVDAGDRRGKKNVRKRQAPSAVEKLVTKRERTKNEPKKSERRRRSSRKDTKTKKKQLVPAA